MPTPDQAKRAAEQAVKAVLDHADSLAAKGMRVSRVRVGPDGLDIDFAALTEAYADASRGAGHGESLDDYRRRKHGGRAA